MTERIDSTPPAARPARAAGTAGAERAERLRALSDEQRAQLLAELRRRGREREAGGAIVRRPAGSPAPLTLAQRRLWFLERLTPQGAGYQVPYNYRLRGPLDRRALAWALAEIARRHEILRTRFELAGAEPIQVTAPAAPAAPPIAAGVAVLALADLRRLPPAAAARETARLAEQEVVRPFDLARGPVWRARLLALDDADHLLQLTFHHIVFDGWSLGLLWDEIEALYAAAVAGSPAALPALPIQYGDFALWQRGRWERGEMEPHLAYWRQRLAASPTLLALPTDRPRPATQSLAGAALPCGVPPPLALRLAALARRSDATLFMLCLAAFAALLQRWTGESDLLIGTPVANRAPAEVERLIGFFLDTLVVRIDAGGDPSFGELLGRVRDGVLADHAHRDMPFERLVAELQPRRDLSHQPLVQVLFAFDDADGRPRRLPGIDVTAHSARSVVTAFDLILSLVHSPAGLTGDWLYGAKLFEPATVRLLHARWLLLLADVAAAPERRLGELAFLTAAESQALRVEWNDTAVAPRAGEPLLAQTLVRQARQRPDAPAVVGGDARLTFGELDAAVDRLARRLRALGVGPETRVAVCVERSPALVVGALGVLAAGGVYVPLDPAHPRERLAVILRDCGARLLLSQGALRDRLPSGDARLLCLDEAWPEAAPGAAPRGAAPAGAPEATPDNLAYIIFTSGSTGGPKGVQVTHGGLRNLAAAQVRAFGLGPGDRILQFASAGFDAWIAELATMVESGAALHLAQPLPLPGAELAALLRERAITAVTLPPSALAVLPPADLPRLRLLITAGEACGADVLERFRDGGREGREGRELWNAYGPTETSVCATLGRCTERGATPPIGRPLDNLTAWVLDAAMRPVALGVPGELYVGGDGVARGYADRPDLTAAAFLPDPFAARPGSRLYRTGDVARRRHDGRLEFLGRRDHQVKVRGCRVELAEVEAALREHPAVAAAVAALVAPDAPAAGGAAGRLAAWIVPADSAGNARAELWPSVAEHLVYDELLYGAMSGDEARNDAYRAAIERLVPGRTVVEIGTGKDAILARLCAAAGASRVYAIELLEEPWRQATERVRRLGLADRITVVRGDARRLELPERVDVCVSEIVGPLGGCEGSAVILNDAWRFLAPGGVMIPRRSVTRIAAVTLPDELLEEPAFGAVQAHYLAAIWKQVGYPFDVRLSVRRFPAGNLLSTRGVFEDLDHQGLVATEGDREIVLEVVRGGRLDGFLLWLELETMPGVVLDILEREHCWLPVYFPAFLPGVEVSAGDTIDATCSIRLSDDGLHPDYGVRGVLRRRRGGDAVPFAHESYHHGRQFGADAYHARLFAALAAGKAGGAVEEPLGAGGAAGGPSAADLRGFLRRRLPDYMVPSVFELVDRLPLLPNGKVDRRALQAAGGGRAGEGVDLAAKTGADAAPHVPGGLEGQVAALWCRVLGRPRVGVDENFFDLGGHSLLMAQVQFELQPLTGRMPSLVDLFAHPTVRSLAAFLAGRDAATADASPAAAPRTAVASEGVAEARGDVAILGMACRFPGAADLDTYWRNLAAGVESIGHFSAQELLAAGVRASTLADARYVRSHGALADVERLDAPFFGFSPREAAVLNPQHRLLLETAWEACEDAGYAPGRQDGRIGVFTGVGANDYWQRHVLADAAVMAAVGPWQAALANLDATAANQISYRLDLTGPSLHVQTTCSTSLVAIHLACRALLAGDCEMALAGAATVNLPQHVGYVYEEQGITSADGHCRAFDAEARGTVPASGAGMVLLKRLADALADGDPIRAVIRGSAVNNNGAGRIGFTAPGVDEQAAVIRAALAAAATPPATIGYVEAHGTGTPLGDPIEVAALHRAFGAGLPPASCGLGSVKGNLGHCDSAAGVAGLIKTVLALEHAVQPASLHFTRPNPEIDFAAGPFVVRSTAARWPAGPTPRRAGVSSFGIGGTNAHVVLEEAPPSAAREEIAGRSQLLLISARSRAALDAATAALGAHLARHPELDAADVAYTLRVGRRVFEHRRALVCRDLPAAVAALGVAADPDAADRAAADALTAVRPAVRRTVALVLSGAAAPHPRDLGGLYRAEPRFRAEIDRAAGVLLPWTGADLRHLVAPPAAADPVGTAGRAAPANAEWERGDLAAAARFACEVALARLWVDRGIPVTAVCGHGSGELAAACVAGIVSLEDGLRWIVGGDAGNVGEVGDVGEVGEVGNAGRRPPAFHPPRYAFLSAATGAWIESGQAETPEGWHERWFSPFDPTVERAPRGPAGELGACLGELLRRPNVALLAAGADLGLAALAARHPDWTPDHTVLPLAGSVPGASPPPEDLHLETLGRLWLAGVEIDWRRWHAGERRRRVSLPTYPFERRRHWVAPRPYAAPGTGAGDRRDERRAEEADAGARSSQGPGTVSESPARLPDLADFFVVPVWRERPLARTAVALRGPGEPGGPGGAGGLRRWLVLLAAEGPGGALAAALERRGREVMRVEAGARLERPAADRWRAVPGSRDDLRQILAALRDEGRLPQGIVHLWQGAPDPDGAFFSLLALAQAIGDTCLGEPLEVVVAAHGIFAVTGEETLSPRPATLLGLCRVLPLEYPNLRCRYIDLPPLKAASPHAVAPAVDSGPVAAIPVAGPPAADVDLIARFGTTLADEVLSTGDAADPVAAWRGRRRWVLGHERLRLAADGLPGAPLRAGGVYLLSGGLGPVGLDLAEMLAREAPGARLAFTGRTRLPAREQWDDWLGAHPEADAIGRVLRRLMRLEELGAEVLPLTADALDAAEMRAALAAIEHRWGPVDGAIHGVGVPDGTLIQLLDARQAAAVLAPRVEATLLLGGLLAGRRRDFFVVSSSIASFGGIGLAAYCAGNWFVDAFAPWYQAATGTPTMAVAWDAWRQIAERYGGDSGGRLAVQLADKLAAEEGSEALRRIVAAGLPQVLVTPHELPVAVAQLRQLWRGASPASAAPAAVGAVGAVGDSGERNERPPLATPYVAPRTPAERRLADLWESMLGLAGIGVDDLWGELGGDSLLALQLVTRIRQVFGIELPAVAVLRNPTLAALAPLLTPPAAAAAAPDAEGEAGTAGDASGTAAAGAAIRPGAANPEAPAGAGSLVLLRPAAGGGRPFFCAPGTGGGVASFADLAACWGDARPFYGLRAVGLLDERPPLTRLEAIAAHYVAALRAAQPSGPYLLGGWSLGGTMAFEMAQQLRRRGEEVALLVLFDAPPPGQFEPEPTIDDATLLAEILGQPLPGPMPAAGAGSAAGSAAAAAESSDGRDETRLGAILAAARQGRSAGADLDTAAARRLLRVCRANIGAAIAYQPRPYAGHIVLVRCRIPLPDVPVGETMGWSALAAGRLDVHWVEGGHSTMLNRPGVESLAPRLAHWLAEAP